jgi:fatty-acyl-CoA synthase
VGGPDRCYDGAPAATPDRRSQPACVIRRSHDDRATVARVVVPGGTGSDPTIEATIGEALRRSARRWGQRTALVTPGADGHRRTWTFSELLSQAEQTAGALLQRFDPGEHVALWAANGPEWPLVEFGAALGGLTLVTVNPAYRAAELAHVLRQSRAVGVLVQPRYRGADLLAAVESVRRDLPGLREVVDLSR